MTAIAICAMHTLHMTPLRSTVFSTHHSLLSTVSNHVPLLFLAFPPHSTYTYINV